MDKNFEERYAKELYNMQELLVMIAAIHPHNKGKFFLNREGLIILKQKLEEKTLQNEIWAMTSEIELLKKTSEWALKFYRGAFDICEELLSETPSEQKLIPLDKAFLEILDENTRIKTILENCLKEIR